MADEEDFSSLPLPDRWVHKQWKVRKEAYEAGAKAFDAAQSENDAVVRQFVQDSSLWKSAVSDSNVAAQQEGLGALCSFLQIAGTQGCSRTRQFTVSPIAEKGLTATRPAAKQKALEALMLYIEVDKADPIIEELVPALSHKQPKVIAATLAALTAIYHAYGCKIVDPKPILKLLPKVFGHADKNVRAESQNLTVELYRWLKEGMKPMFWNDLKPVQQTDIEKLFEKVKDEPPARQERLLRSQQAIQESAVEEVATGDQFEEQDDAPMEFEPEFEAVNVLSKVPKDFQEKLNSSKWKDRKEALDALQGVINVPRIEAGHFDDILRALAKCMKDANISVVIVAANCIELLAKGLKKDFTKYRSTVMDPMMERLKEKKQTVTDAIGAALDAVFTATSLSDCLEGLLEFLKHKNPQVKIESTRFLIRSLRTTRDPPQPTEAKLIADASTKLLTESQEIQRNAGAEVLGTLWKIIGDRGMGPFLNDLDEIRKTKIKEYFDSAEVKAKVKPPKPAPVKTAPSQKRMGVVGGPGVKKAPPSAKKPAPALAPVAVEEPAALAPRPSSRPVSKLNAPKSGLSAPSGGLRPPAGLARKPPGSANASPVRKLVSPVEEYSAPTPAPPKLAMGAGRGLASRSLARPAPANESNQPHVTPSGLSGINSAEKAELEELRAENDRLRRESELLRADKAHLSSRVAQLSNHNSELIEDHDREVLSLRAKEKAKERHVEALEQQVQSQQREIERLKRELSRQVRASSPAPMELLQDGPGSLRGSRAYVTSPTGKSSTSSSGFTTEGKENFAPSFASPRSSRYGMASPVTEVPSSYAPSGNANNGGPGAGGAESWKRAAEVTQNLKARIEMMKAKQGLSSIKR